MKSTIADARSRLEEQLPTLSDYWAQRWKRLIESREAKATERAEAFAQQRAKEVLAMRDEALHALTEARDGYDQLTREAADARIPVHEYTRRLVELQRRQAQAEEQLVEAQKRTELIAAVEADPVAWADEQTRRLPVTLPNWEW